MNRFHLKSAAVCCAAVSAFAACQSAQADDIFVSWDIWKNTVDFGNGTSVGIGQGVITIWDCDDETDTYNWDLTESTATGLVFLPDTGCVTVPPGQCVDIPFIVLCKGGGPGLFARFDVTAVNKDDPMEVLTDDGVVRTRLIMPNPMLPPFQPFEPRIDAFEPIARAVIGDLRTIKFQITNPLPQDVTFGVGFDLFAQGDANVTLLNDTPFEVTIGAEASVIVEAQVMVEADSALNVGADLFLGIDFNGDGLIEFPPTPGMRGVPMEPEEVAVATIIQTTALPGEPNPLPSDLDGNGVVGSGDLAILLGDWGMTLP